MSKNRIKLELTEKIKKFMLSRNSESAKKMLAIMEALLENQTYEKDYIYDSYAKAGAFAYGIAITTASTVDAVRANNLTARCLFTLGAACGAAGTASTGVSLAASISKTNPENRRDLSVLLTPYNFGLTKVGVATNLAAGMFYFLGKRANEVAREVDI